MIKTVNDGVKRWPGAILALALLVSVAGCAARRNAASATPAAGPSAAATVAGTARATGAVPTAGATAQPDATPAAPVQDPFALISIDSLFETLEDLTAIQPYSGWRGSATEGEREALNYVAGRLAELTTLDEWGLEIERQTFRVPIATEFWESGLTLHAGGRDVEVPAASLRGERETLELAMLFDSDGAMNDRERDPVTADGPLAVIRTAEELDASTAASVDGRVVLLDYAVIDRVLGDASQSVARASELLAKAPAAIVLVTQNSNEPGQSHGFGAGDLSAFTYAQPPAGLDRPVPILLIRLEDVEAAGVGGWEGLSGVESARVTWDADILAPAESGNLAARIPGRDPSRALILGAHIDSSNNPGAMDDGSGVAILLEVARVLDAARVRPAVDLVLVWFGSEELGLYGSSYFANTHQELLDRTVGMLGIDDLTRPLDGIPAELTLITQSYGRLGNGEMPWPEALSEAAAGRGVETVAANSYTPWSDNTPFGGYDVPNADLIFMDEAAMEATGSLHYAAHIHDPYDTVETAREVAGVFEEMARVALSAALDVDLGESWRVTPSADRRAVLVGSHTEMAHMTPASLVDFGMALSLDGYDVDLVPYGREVTAADLEGAALVVALPVVDLVPPADDAGAYDEAWTAPEIDVLEQYVASGGLLVLTNSANRIKYYNRVLDPNEDAGDANALAARFGVAYGQGVLSGGQATVAAGSPLTEGLAEGLSLAAGNGLVVQVMEGRVLAQAGGQAAVALVPYGRAGGEVLVLADLGLLGTNGGSRLENLRFWQNLAEYARGR